MLKDLSIQKDILYLINKYTKSLSRLEAELLLSYFFKCSKTNLYLNDLSVDEEAEKLCDHLVERRLLGEPVQYIIGSTEFMDKDFVVNKDVLIPRPETEILVNEVLSLARKNDNKLDVLDLCTGSGNIGITLASQAPNVEIISTDISKSSLKVAQYNSFLHGTDKSMTFYEGDLFKALPFDKKYKFDIIVCNPPYVKREELEFLQKEVTKEPKLALDGGIDGLDFYRKIADNAGDYLKPKGSLFLELGVSEAENVKNIFDSKGIFKTRDIKKDFAEIDRVIWISLL